jgi:hypothetical protein
MKKSSRKFLIDTRIKTQFNYLCDSLGLKKDAWACFFIGFEMDFFKNERGLPTNSAASLKYLEAQRAKTDKQEYSIKMSQEFVERIDYWCSYFNFTRVMLVEFSLMNACNRIDLEKKLATQRSDLLPLYLLEHSLTNRLKHDQRYALIKECLIIGNMK